MNSENQQVVLPILTQKEVTLYLKREDEIHPLISGNKYRKLKYNIRAAKDKGIDQLLTYGGAFSNHIAATAYAGYVHKLKTIGVIRGEELINSWQENPTLKRARSHGMHFNFVSRAQYKSKNDAAFLSQLEEKYGRFYRLPEGGTNTLAVKGCEEIITVVDASFNVICCCVGTGGTLAGISNAAYPKQQIIGFPALKGDFLKKDIRKFATRTNWRLQTEYTFGGYAKIDEELVGFINAFKAQTQIPLDPVYTGKMLYGILDLVAKDRFPKGTKILAIHSGGLQGISGMNLKLKKKKLPLLTI